MKCNEFEESDLRRHIITGTFKFKDFLTPPRAWMLLRGLPSAYIDTDAPAGKG
jgi:hypothetical protein